MISWKTIRLTGTFGFEDLQQVPGDRLAFTVLISGQQQLVGVGEFVLQLLDAGALVGVDDI